MNYELILPFVLQEHYVPYQEQHVGYQEGHFYGNQQSYSRGIGEVPFDKKDDYLEKAEDGLVEINYLDMFK